MTEKGIKNNESTTKSAGGATTTTAATTNAARSSTSSDLSTSNNTDSGIVISNCSISSVSSSTTVPEDNEKNNLINSSTNLQQIQIQHQQKPSSSSTSMTTSTTTTTTSNSIKDTSALEAALKGDPQYSRFADYFVICGLDLDTGLEPDRFAGDSLHCSPLDRAYKSKPLCHYPEYVAWNPFDSHGICMLSLPQGLRFRTQKHNIEPRFHSFATTREDGKRCHGFSLIFYEEVRNRNICSAMHTLQSMFITELSSGQTTAALRRVKESSVSRSLPRHFKLAAQAPASALSYYDVTKDKLYVAKSISLLCQVPYAYAAEIFLNNLYKCLPRQPGPGLSLESYVYNILYEVMLPQPGKSIRIYLPPEEPHLPPIQMILQRPGLYDELPLLDFPVRLLFTYLGVECVIQLLTCVLLENQVLLRSNDHQKLMIIGECVTSLLHPFVWPHVYAPILPAALHHFLDAPVPFVMGLHADCETVTKIGSEATLCYVDIDKRTIQLPEELPIFPHKFDFMSEIITILDKFQIQRDRTLEPPSILNPKTFYQQRTISNNSNGSSSDYDVMTSSCTLPSGIQVRGRKHSMHDSFYGGSNIDNHLSEMNPLINGGNNSSGGCISPKPQTSEPITRMVDLVKRTGVKIDDFGYDTTDCSMPNRKHNKEKPLTKQEQYIEDQRLNNSIREIFLNRFVHMFAAYEHFVIYPNQGKNEWLSNRESLQNFDKSSFLSDQPEHHRPFLSRFLESQMFATLIDNKIMAVWDKEIDLNLRLFDCRIKILRKRHGGESLIRATSYEPCVLSQETQRILDKRLQSIDLEVTPPSEILPNRPAYFRSFPLLEKSVLNQECASRGNSLRRVKNGSTKWRTKEINLDGKPPPFPNSNRNSANLSTTEMSPALIAQANWTFVEKLLKDIKSKTKRMLLEKMGSEAFSLGLGSEGAVNGVEENTMIASLCDLLEKIWSHGLQNKQGKSALWSHLQAYLELQETRNPSNKIDTNYLTPDLSTFTIDSTDSLTRGRPRERSNSIIGLEQLRPLPESLEFDIKNVLAMTDIKTHIGYTRAWVRLSLEKKLLSRHFRTLLSDQVLLRTLYKRSAFLRCEEEKEQFLYHILTLNTVDYFCFTNIYPTTKLPYRVVIFPSKKHGNNMTSSNVWVAISGAMNETKQIPVPKEAVEFIFHYKNLGNLTTMRIGHDNSGPNNKWLVEHVVVRNEVTGHTYKFPCGRWLGKGIDDGSTERLLVGQRVPKNIDNDELVQVCRTPPRARSPSIQRTELRPSEIQNMLGDCVNVIVKWHYKPSRDRDVGSLTNFLCGEDGLVKCLEHVFMCGFRSTRFFGRNLYIWDYFLKIKDQFEMNINHDNTDNNTILRNNSGVTGSPLAALNSPNPDSPYLTNMSLAQRHEWLGIWRCFVYLIDEINAVTNTLGKDGKFQLLICLCLREHILHRMLSPMASTKVTHEMYEEQSFLRRRGLLTFLIQILEPLDTLEHIVLENSITQGIPSQYLSTFTIDSTDSLTRGRPRERSNSIIGLEQLRPLPESLEFDIKNVLAMTDIKTHIGYTRAWVRLSLEKKLLSRHFRTLLSDQVLLRTLYKRSAFLRCEEEKEQFLYHILTLNTVDYFCFTNIYPTTKLPYRVVIFPSKKHGNNMTSSNVWVAISGAMNETKQIPVPKEAVEFIFHYKNLGNLTTMRIGHDNSGPNNKWLVEHVVVRNEVTGHTYKFPCGRWLGKGIDDGSTERLLVGQRVPKNIDNDELVQVCRTPPRARSPSIQRTELRPSEIQNMLGDCVNVIVKWHYKPSRDRDVGSLTNFLCGEDGLVKCLEHVFMCGFRSTRFFGRNLYIWDYFLKIKDQFEMNINHDNTDNNTILRNNSGVTGSPLAALNSPNPDSPYLTNMSLAQRHEWLGIWRCFVYLIDEINAVTNTLGKDGKFQLLICLCLREHILHRMLSPMASTKVTHEMYEEQSFLRRRGLLTFLIQILEPLDTLEHIVLENSITQGIPSQC